MAPEPLPESPLRPPPPRDAAVAPVDEERAQRLRQDVKELQQKKKELSERLDKLLVRGISEEHEAAKYREKAKLKDKQAATLEVTLSKQKDKAKRLETNLQEHENQLRTELAVLENDLYHTKALKGSPADPVPLRSKLTNLQTDNAKLTRHIRDLTVGAFCSSADLRLVSQQRLQELESLVQRKSGDCERLTTDRRRVEGTMQQDQQESTQLEEKCHALMQENERLEIRLEEKGLAAQRAQAALKDTLDNFSEEDRKVLVFSMQFLREQEQVRRVAMGEAQASPAADPLVLLNIGSDSAAAIAKATREVDELRAQKDELAREMLALQEICKRERDITKDLREMQRLDLDEIGTHIQNTMADVERLKRTAVEREKRIQVLQKQLVTKRERLQPALLKSSPLELPTDLISTGGFSSLSDVAIGTNVLDLYITAGRIEERALLELPKQPGSEELPLEGSLATMVMAEFMHFDVGCTQTATTLRPRFDSLVNFGPFEVGDAEIEHVAKGSIRLELHAFSPGGTSAYVLGRACLPLVAVLDCTPQDPNPVVAGTLCFAEAAGGRLQVAALQYKLRWRRSIVEPLQAFMWRRGVSPAELATAATPEACAGLMGAARALIVHIRGVEGLVPWRIGVPAEHLRPYVSCEIPGHRESFTKTLAGPSCHFDEVFQVVVSIDAEFCHWASTGEGMHLVVFDAGAASSAATEEQLGLIGEIHVPVERLLSSPLAAVEGRFPLRRGGKGQAGGSPSVGFIDLAIRWRDDPSAVLTPAAAGAAVSSFITDEQYQITWQRIIRRLRLLAVTFTDWFYKHDVDKDGFWSREETVAALLSVSIGLSPMEMNQVFVRLDSRRRGAVTLEDVAAAVGEGSKAAPLEQWVRDVYRGIAQALLRQGLLAEQAFDAVAQHRRAQKREFFALVTSLDLGLKLEQLEWLWRLSDTRSDGLLDYSEFAARLGEATGAVTTAYRAPDRADLVGRPPAPAGASATTAALAAESMPDAWFEACLARLLAACHEQTWRSLDRIMGQLDVREDGLVPRASLLSFCQRTRACLSDWEIDQVSMRLDLEAQAAFQPRLLRTALLKCDVVDAPSQAVLRRAGDCISQMRQGLMKAAGTRPSASNSVGEQVSSALRSLLKEAAAQKEPLLVSRQELVAVAIRLGADKVWMDELWFSLAKLRDGSLDVDSLVSRVASAPLPGEVAGPMTSEQFSILMGKVKRQMELQGLGSVGRAFQAFHTRNDGCISPAELETFLAQIAKDSMSAHERQQLVRKIDANGDGRISIAEFEAALAREQSSASALGRWAEDICARVAGSLRREGRSADQLFDALAGSSGEVYWPNFHALFSKIEPTLAETQLRLLWQVFDKNGDGGVSRAEFQRELAPKPAASTGHDGIATGVPGEVASAAVLASRVGRAAAASGLSLQAALSAHSSTDARGFDVEGWLQACRALRLPLSWAEATTLHAALVHGASGRMRPSDLQAEISRVMAYGVPEERWARELVASSVQLASDAGRPTPEQFLSAQAEAVDEQTMRAALSQGLALQDEQWAQLRLLVERRPEDGLMLWRNFLQWAHAVGPGSSLSAVSEEVCRRVSAALHREGRSVEQLFAVLAAGKAEVHWGDFRGFFATVESNLTEAQLRELWSTFDKNGDGGVSLAEFCRSLTAVDDLVHATTANILERVRSALRRQHQSADELFQALAGVKTEVHWPDFQSLFARIEPSITDQQLGHLWQTFDKNGDGGVSREEFRRALEGTGAPAPGRGVVGEELAQAVCSHVTAALRKAGTSVEQLFQTLAGGGADVQYPDFRAFFAKVEPALTDGQLKGLWRTFDKNGDGGVSLGEFRKALATVDAVSNTATQTVCARITDALRRKGQSVDQLFMAIAGGKAELCWSDFRPFFAKFEPSLTTEQLEHLWRIFDKDSDDSVSIHEFRRTLPEAPGSAGPSTSAPTAASLEIAICSRINTALQRQGHSKDQLFEVLAAGKAEVHWPDFKAFLASIEHSLSVPQLEELWRTFDKNHDGGVSREEFKQALAAVEDATGAITAEVCTRINQALLRQGTSVDQFFDALAGDKVEVLWSDFHPLFAKLEPSLTEAQLEHLCCTFDTDGDGKVSRTEFREALAFAGAEKISSTSTSETCDRILGALRRKGQTGSQVFDALASGREVLSWPDFRMLSVHLEPSLSEKQLEHFWRTLPKGGDNCVSRQEFLRGLGLGSETAPEAAAHPPMQPQAVVAEPPPLPPPGPSATSSTMDLRAQDSMTDLVEAILTAIGEVLVLRAPDEAPRESEALFRGVRGQLREFGQSGQLDQLAFAQALRAYSPSLSDPALAMLWDYIGGPADGAVRISVEAVARRLVFRTRGPHMHEPVDDDDAIDRIPTDHMTSDADDSLWSLLGRLRLALHVQGWSLRTAFGRFSQGAPRLTQEALGQGLVGLGCDFRVEELEAVYASMASRSDSGATEDEFLDAFSGMGTGFEAYARKLFSRVGAAVLGRAGGSPSAAFALLDPAGAGAIHKAEFTAAMHQFGDRNLSELQHSRVWELALTIAGHVGGSLDISAFGRLFKPAMAAKVPPPRSEISLEQACDHLGRLNCTSALREALHRRNPDGLLPRADIGAAITEVAPELSPGEVEQICRLAAVSAPAAPGGPNACDFHALLARFEDGHRDWHPVPQRDRAAAADVCRYVDAQLQRWGFESLYQFLATAWARSGAAGEEVDSAAAMPVLPASLPGHELLEHLRKFLPRRQEDARIAEMLVLHMGRPLRGGVDVADFCVRFDELARGVPPVGVAGPRRGSGAPRPASRQAYFREKAAPVDVSSLGSTRVAELAAILRQAFPEGIAPFDKLHRELETELQLPMAARQQDLLKKWLDPEGRLSVYPWPLLFAFDVCVESVAVTAPRAARRSYPQLFLRIGFCDEEVTSKPVPWRVGMMCLSQPNTMDLQPRWHALFCLDGPGAIAQEDIARAMARPSPESHRLRVTLCALRGVGRGGGGQSESDLGTFDICVCDLPTTDGARIERTLECRLVEAAASAKSDQPQRLSATVVLSTRRVGRLYEALGGGVSGVTPTTSQRTLAPSPASRQRGGWSPMNRRAAGAPARTLQRWPQ